MNKRIYALDGRGKGLYHPMESLRLKRPLLGLNEILTIFKIYGVDITILYCDVNFRLKWQYFICTNVKVLSLGTI